MKHSERIGTLMFKHIRLELSREETKELTAWRNLSSENNRFFLESVDPENIRVQFKRIYDARGPVHEKLKAEFKELFEAKPKAKISRMNLFLRYAAAVSITIGLFWAFSLFPSVQSGGYNATVVSPEGTKDNLNSFWRDLKRGFHDGYSGIIRKTVNGQLIYAAPNEDKKSKDRYYTLFTKNGGEYGLQLADGTMIWVNAATTIRYPANISQDTINITVDGEAFFEIPDSVKNIYRVYTAFNEKSLKPNGQGETSTINDLRSPDDAVEIVTRAAQFNVVSYANEPAPAISLFSGSAIMRLDTASQASAASIAAGQQVKLDYGKLEITQITNAGDVIAWKNNQTSFHDVYIESILREVARWYDVKIVYDSEIPNKKYSITIPRDAKIEDLLEVLRKQGGQFMIHGRTITVSN